MHPLAPRLLLTLDSSISGYGWSDSIDVYRFTRHHYPSPPSSSNSAGLDGDQSSYRSSASSEQDPGMPSPSRSTPPSSPLDADGRMMTTTACAMLKLSSSPPTSSNGDFADSKAESGEGFSSSPGSAIDPSSSAGGPIPQASEDRTVSQVFLSTLLHVGSTWKVYRGSVTQASGHPSESDTETGLVFKVMTVPTESMLSTAYHEARAYARMQSLQGLIVPTFHGFYELDLGGGGANTLMLVMILEDVGSPAEISLKRCSPDLKQKITDAFNQLHALDIIQDQVNIHHLCFSPSLPERSVNIIDFTQAKLYDADSNREDLKKLKVLEQGDLQWLMSLTPRIPMTRFGPGGTWSVEFVTPSYP